MSLPFCASNCCCPFGSRLRPFRFSGAPELEYVRAACMEVRPFGPGSRGVGTAWCCEEKLWRRLKLWKNKKNESDVSYQPIRKQRKILISSAHIFVLFLFFVLVLSTSNMHSQESTSFPLLFLSVRMALILPVWELRLVVNSHGSTSNDLVFHHRR